MCLPQSAERETAEDNPFSSKTGHRDRKICPARAPTLPRTLTAASPPHSLPSFLFQPLEEYHWLSHSPTSTQRWHKISSSRLNTLAEASPPLSGSMCRAGAPPKLWSGKAGITSTYPLSTRTEWLFLKMALYSFGTWAWEMLATILSLSQRSMEPTPTAPS